MTRTLSFAILTCLCLSNVIACGANTSGSPVAPAVAVQSAGGAASGASTSAGSSTTAGPSVPASSPAAPESHEDRELEGLVTAVPPTTLAGQFRLGDKTVITTAATVITLNGHTGLFTDLVVGARVHVKGTSSGTSGAVTATAVMIQNATPNSPSPGDTDDDRDDDASHAGEVELRGAVSLVSGACPVIRFTVANTVVVTNTATRFDLACTAVVPTRAVEVKGTRAADGTVTATRIKRQ